MRGLRLAILEVLRCYWNRARWTPDKIIKPPSNESVQASSAALQPRILVPPG
jgi:hypothetical protein